MVLEIQEQLSAMAPRLAMTFTAPERQEGQRTPIVGMEN